MVSLRTTRSTEMSLKANVHKCLLNNPSSLPNESPSFLTVQRGSIALDARSREAISGVRKSTANAVVIIPPTTTRASGC
jgi:hypothetical protein